MAKKDDNAKVAKRAAERLADARAAKKAKGPTKTEKLIELLKGNGGTVDELVKATGMSEAGLRSMLYYHLPKKKGVKVKRSEDGKYHA